MTLWSRELKQGDWKRESVKRGDGKPGSAKRGTRMQGWKMRETPALWLWVADPNAGCPFLSWWDNLRYEHFLLDLSWKKQEAQLPQRNRASAAHVCAADALFLCGSCIGIGTIVKCTEHRRIAEVVLFLTFKRSDLRSAGQKRILSWNSHHFVMK